MRGERGMSDVVETTSNEDGGAEGLKGRTEGRKEGERKEERKGSRGARGARGDYTTLP